MRGVLGMGVYFLSLVALALASSQWVACSPLEDESTAGVKLTVIKITARNAEGQESDWLASDVVRIDPDTGQETVFEDTARVDFRNDWLNLAIEPTPFNDVIVIRYRVEYFRPDGQNRPGVHVPFPFDAVTNIRVPVNGTGAGEIVVVKAQAKLEDPLWGLRFGGREREISAYALLTFFGHDLFGRNVTTHARLEIHFANWADQQ
ncbi:MAG: hypothetical protein NZ742_04215 [Acidobacteria bacterium]|nr:hypothetical protein [Acidobacteriota bacterium]MDW7984120.1 hypothetical protein [Acidobacteriota bacterium]